MDSEGKKFGKGPRELTGAVDLINYYKLWAHHDFFCKRSLPLSVSDTHYLHSVAGDTEIRKGEGMELDQLFQNTLYARDSNARIQPFGLDTLSEAFQLRETTPIELPSAEKGIPTIPGKSKSDSKDKERKHKKHKDKDKDKDKEHKKHKHRHKDKDRSKDKEKEKKKDKSGHHDKKRKHDGSEDLGDVHKHKKNKVPSNMQNLRRITLVASNMPQPLQLFSRLMLLQGDNNSTKLFVFFALFQHKSSKINEIGAIKVAG